MGVSIQYATSAPGESIACCVLGDGPPLVVVPSGPWTIIQVQQQVPAWWVWNTRLAARRRVVLYDLGGTGLSGPSSEGLHFSLDQQVADLKGVLSSLALPPVALFGAQHAGPAAISFAAQYPEMVTHLVLWCTYGRGADYLDDVRSQAVHTVMTQDWDLFTETVAHAQLGWSEAATAQQFAALLREHVPPAQVSAFDAASRDVDVLSLLSAVRMPTLVVHRAQVRHPEVGIARQLAAGLPHGRLAVLDGNSVAPFVGDADAALAMIEGFLEPTGAAQRDRRGVGRSTQSSLAEGLSTRERQVLQLLAAGLTNNEIAVELVVAPGTAKTHTASIYRKLDVTSRTRAVARARQLGLIDDL